MKQPRTLIIALLLALLIGQTVQTVLVLRGQRDTQRTAESAEMAAIDALEVAKQVRDSQTPTVLTAARK